MSPQGSPNRHGLPRLAGDSLAEMSGNTHSSRADLALPFDGIAGLEARRPARSRPARVRHASRRGLRARQAPRDGLRDADGPRRDRRRAGARVAPRRRVRLRGADRRLPRRRRAGRARPVLGCHPGAVRDAPGRRERRRGRRRLRRGGGDRRRARAPVLRRRRAPDRPPPPPAGAAVRRLGDPQRLARAGAQPARRGVRRHPRRDRHRRLRRPRGRRHRAHLDRHAAGGRLAHVPRARSRRPGGGGRQARLGR